jgi:hypothetical protein
MMRRFHPKKADTHGRKSKPIPFAVKSIFLKFAKFVARKRKCRAVPV